MTYDEVDRLGFGDPGRDEGDGTVSMEKRYLEA